MLINRSQKFTQIPYNDVSNLDFLLIEANLKNYRKNIDLVLNFLSNFCLVEYNININEIVKKSFGRLWILLIKISCELDEDTIKIKKVNAQPIISPRFILLNLKNAEKFALELKKMIKDEDCFILIPLATIYWIDKGVVIKRLYFSSITEPLSGISYLKNFKIAIIGEEKFKRKILKILRDGSLVINFKRLVKDCIGEIVDNIVDNFDFYLKSFLDALNDSIYILNFTSLKERIKTQISEILKKSKLSESFKEFQIQFTSEATLESIRKKISKEKTVLLIPFGIPKNIEELLLKIKSTHGFLLKISDKYNITIFLKLKECQKGWTYYVKGKRERFGYICASNVTYYGSDFTKKLDFIVETFIDFDLIKTQIGFNYSKAIIRTNSPMNREKILAMLMHKTKTSHIILNENKLIIVIPRTFFIMKTSGEVSRLESREKINQCLICTEFKKIELEILRHLEKYLNKFGIEFKITDGEQIAKLFKISTRPEIDYLIVTIPRTSNEDNSSFLIASYIMLINYIMEWIGLFALSSEIAEEKAKKQTKIDEFIMKYKRSDSEEDIDSAFYGEIYKSSENIIHAKGKEIIKTLKRLLKLKDKGRIKKFKMIAPRPGEMVFIIEE